MFFLHIIFWRHNPNPLDGSDRSPAPQHLRVRRLLNNFPVSSLIILEKHACWMIYHLHYFFIRLTGPPCLVTWIDAFVLPSVRYIVLLLQPKGAPLLWGSQLGSVCSFVIVAAGPCQLIHSTCPEFGLPAYLPLRFSLRVMGLSLVLPPPVLGT